MLTKISKTMDIRVFHRKIAIRIAMAGVILAVLFASLAWFSMNRKIMRQVTEQAVSGTRQFNSQIAYLLNTPDWKNPAVLEKEAHTFVINNSRYLEEKDGTFMYVAFFNTDFNMITSVSASPGDPMIEELKSNKDQLAQILKNPKSQLRRLYFSHGVPYILNATPLVDDKGNTIAYVESVFRVSPQAIHDAKADIFKTVLAVIGIVLITTGALYPTIISLTHRLGRLTLNLLHSNMETLEVLGSAIAKKDSETVSHNYRVTLYAVRLAEIVGLEPLKIQGLIKGAFLHDVGKIGVRDNILLKPGKLNTGEYEMMKNHVRHGLDIVNRSAWLDDANQVVAYHHEKFDGTGYFAGLKGEEIPLIARIFAIADVFDALTSRRPYKDPVSFLESMDILEQEKGSHFDPELVDTFGRIAEGLYNEYAGRDDEYLKQVLTTIRERYFREHTVFH